MPVVKAAFWASAGLQIGNGHAVRCSALADELETIGDAESRIFVRGTAPSFALGRRFETDRRIAEDLEHWCPDVLVLDGVMPDENYLGPAIDCEVVQLADESGAIYSGANAVMQLSVASADIGPARSIPSAGGSQYVILRRQFDSPRTRICSPAVKTAVVAFGGTDAAGLMPQVIRHLKEIANFAPERIVIVSGTKDGNEAATLAAAGDRRFEMRCGVSNMREVFENADIGIVSGGTLLYEAACTGLPVIVVAVTESEDKEARVFEDSGAVLRIGRAQSLNASAIAKGLQILASAETRQGMSQTGQRMIDGSGRRRVAEFLLHRAVPERS